MSSVAVGEVMCTAVIEPEKQGSVFFLGVVLNNCRLSKYIKVDGEIPGPCGKPLPPRPAPASTGTLEGTLSRR